jgi:hypothetical protein
VTIRLPILLLVVLMLEWAAGAVAPKQNNHPPALAGTVYFYYHGFQQPPGMFGPTSLAVLVDGRVVASPKAKTFFGIRLAPGRHSFASKSRRTNPKETAIELDITPGQHVFIRLDMRVAALGIVKYTAHLRIVGQEEGRAMVAALQPLDVKHIEDKTRVTIEAPTPAQEESSNNNPEPVRLAAPLPEEQGIYAFSPGTLQRIPGEITNFRTAPVHGLTAIVKNARSGTRLKAPLEFVLRCSPETTAAEYVLMHLFTRGDRREFRTLLGGTSVMQQGPERMTVPFEAHRIAPDVYHMKILAVPKGEYGFVGPGLEFKASATGSFVTYTFGVD